MVESFAPTDTMVLGDLYERLGRIHEDAGRAEQAIYYYDRFVRAWAGADEDHLPKRRAVEERLSRLLGGGIHVVVVGSRRTIALEDASVHCGECAA